MQNRGELTTAGILEMACDGSMGNMGAEAEFDHARARIESFMETLGQTNWRT